MKDIFYSVFEENILKTAIIFNEGVTTYKSLIKSIAKWKTIILSNGIKSGQIIALNGDFTPNSIAILFALIDNKNIIVPLDYRQANKNVKKIEIACVSKSILIDEYDNVSFNDNDNYSSHPFYQQIRKLNKPGLVLFSSGSSGEPKAAVHDLSKLLLKFKIKRGALRTLNFLLFDHWGGLNTMFHILSNGGVVITTKERSTYEVCKLIDIHKIELLPASPTFLKLLIFSNDYNEFNLSSLKVISYGTEPMPENTLKKLRDTFPNVKLLQTYGLIELGVMRSKSKSDDSLWVKIGGDGYQTRVVDGLLEVKAESAMLGYLNAPSPFTEDGWFKTLDVVEVDGEYMKILGRKSEIINVGGEKVFPQEVENIILELDFVQDVVVFGEKNLIIGNIVSAKVQVVHNSDLDKKVLISKIKMHCAERLSKYKVPLKVVITNDELLNARFKKDRFGATNEVNIADS